MKILYDLLLEHLFTHIRIKITVSSGPKKVYSLTSNRLLLHFFPLPFCLECMWPSNRVSVLS